ncbi:MAG: 3-isopropylmalate dehydratase large subunit, partial [Mucinivorans sp.]
MKTIIDKIWDAHVVRQLDGGRSVLYIDRHYIHEVTSPVAFGGMRRRALPLYHAESIVATADHNTPTVNQHLATDVEQLKAFSRNCTEFGIPNFFPMGHPNNGVVHIIGPELGFTLPGMTIVCGDSHTSTHGAFGAIAFGVGTSEVEMVMASQCLLQAKPRKMRINVQGKLGRMVTAKDVALYIISQLTTSGATGHFVEFAGEAIRSLSMEGRMTLCNLSIECGARGGIIAPDEKTFEYLKGRAPFNEAWRDLFTDPEAIFDKEYTFRAEDIEPMITWGTNPGQGTAITGCVGEDNRYMDFCKGEKMLGKKVDYVFMGSCTNGRIEDFELFASVVKGHHKAPDVVAWIVPGSWRVRKQCDERGITKILEDAGFALRQPGCSACLAMNDDKIPAGKYSVS